MRITNGILHSGAIHALRSGLSSMEEAQQRVATGLKLQRPSDDPARAREAMRARGGLRAVDQYRRNVDGALSRLGSEDGVLQTLGDVLTRARELGIGQNSATMSATGREAARQEAETLLDAAAQLASTSLNGEFIFGGLAPDTPPVSKVAGSWVVNPAASAGRTVEAGEGLRLVAGHGATEVFQDSGVLPALEALAAALALPDPGPALDTALADLDAAFESVQTLVGDVGARLNHLETVDSNLESLSVNLQLVRSDLEDAELEEELTRLMTRQTAYQAALLTNSRILSTTLADYLR